MIDLHLHSTYSDGVDTPRELVETAVSCGLRAIALTDHDTIDGTPEFLAACRDCGMAGFAGVEISAQSDIGTLHILGIGVNPGDDELGGALSRIRRSREDRNRRILEKLRSLGFPLTWEEVQSFAGDDVVGRPHFARAMVARGWAETPAEVFSKFLEKGAPAYFERLKPSPAETIAVIRGAGGLAAVAHPSCWIYKFPALERRIDELVREGLEGLEAYHPSHDALDVRELLRIAREKGLLVTGGSDYHGEEIKPGVRMGTGTGSLSVPDSLLEPLVARVGRSGGFAGKEVVQ